jgi:hypothetical protein
MFPMMWRFLPTLDLQVDLVVSRDLDGRLSARGAAAVAEWAAGSAGLHVMRDHPQHNVAIMGGAWGARLTMPEARDRWARAWAAMAADPMCWSARGSKGPDQTLLARHVWPWARASVLQHDSYNCAHFPGAVGFPTRRTNGTGNFIGTPPWGRVWLQCPAQCRRAGHPDWTHC